MAEVVDWSPVDESNNTAPPVGAPENMAPSAVNNTMRAMMGSIRRWYDTVATQLASYLKLTGGTVTGDVTFNGPNGITISGTKWSKSGVGLEANPGFISSRGANAGFYFSDRDTISPAWLWYANLGTAHLLRSGGSPLISANWGGQVNITGSLAVSSGIIANVVQANADIVAADDITAGGDISASGNIIAGGIFNAPHMGSSTLNVTGLINAGSIDVAGNVNVEDNIIVESGIINAPHIGSSTLNVTGLINAGSINPGSINVSGNASVSGTSTLTQVSIVGNINSIGNDPNFYIRKVGSQRVINFEPNTYLMFDATTNNFSIVIDGVTKASW